MYLKQEQLKELRRLFGGFDSSEELVKRIKRRSSIPLPGTEVQLTSDQHKILVKKAVSRKKFHTPGFRCETPEQEAEVVKWYVDKQVQEFLGRLLRS